MFPFSCIYVYKYVCVCVFNTICEAKLTARVFMCHSYRNLATEHESLMQKYLHLLQIVETEKTVAKQLRQQIEDGEIEIERLKSEVKIHRHSSHAEAAARTDATCCLCREPNIRSTTDASSLYADEPLCVLPITTGEFRNDFLWRFVRQNSRNINVITAVCLI